MRLYLPLLLLAAVGSAALAAPSHALPMGSFLLRPVDTAGELRHQVSRQPGLMVRYSQVFGSPAEASRVLSDLRLKPLARDWHGYVYNWRGRVGYRYRRVRKGSLVFVDSSGEPVLLRICGNPLRRKPGRPDPILAPKRSSSDFIPEPEARILSPDFTAPPLEPEIPDFPGVLAPRWTGHRLIETITGTPLDPVGDEVLEVPVDPPFLPVLPLPPFGWFLPGNPRPPEIVARQPRPVPNPDPDPTARTPTRSVEIPETGLLPTFCAAVVSLMAPQCRPLRRARGGNLEEI